MNAPAVPQEPTVLVHVNVEVATAALTAVVQNAKQMAGRDESGHYRVDTAEKVGEMISRFLQEKNFTAFAEEISNYNQGESV